MRALATLLLALFGQMGVGPAVHSQLSPVWSYVQFGYNNGCASGTTCSVGVSATTAGSVMVASIFDLTGAGDTITSVTGGGGTWNTCTSAGCKATVGGFSLNTAYNITGTGGATSITVNINASNASWYAMVGEFKCTANCGTISLDAAASANYTNSSCTTLCSGTPFTGITGASDLIVNTVNRATAAGTPSSPYTYGTIPGMWMAYALNYNSGIAPTLPLTTAGPFGAIGLAFK
jgi:hypothetical protein